MANPTKDIKWSDFDDCDLLIALECIRITLARNGKCLVANNGNMRMFVEKIGIGHSGDFMDYPMTEYTGSLKGRYAPLISSDN